MESVIEASSILSQYKQHPTQTLLTSFALTISGLLVRLGNTVHARKDC